MSQIYGRGFLGKIWRISRRIGASDIINLFPQNEAIDMKRSAAKAFQNALELFSSLGLINQEIILEISDVSYKVKCDQNSFMVYRIHNNCGPKSHVPGWPVCLVTHDTIFEECTSSDGMTDCFHCGLTLDKWLELVESDYAGNPAPGPSPCK